MTEKSYDQFVGYILQNQDRFYRLAYFYIDDQNAAMDIVQRSIDCALNTYDTFHNSNRICFYRILVNECRNMEENTNRLTDIQDRVMQTIRQLDFIHCMVLILYYFEDFSLEEVAQIMQTTQDAIETCLSDLLRIL